MFVFPTRTLKRLRSAATAQDIQFDLRSGLTHEMFDYPLVRLAAHETHEHVKGAERQQSKQNLPLFPAHTNLASSAKANKLAPTPTAPLAVTPTTLSMANAGSLALEIEPAHATN